MSSVSKNVKKNTAVRCDSAKRRRNIDALMAREMNAFYRESDPVLLTDSGESSAENSISNDSDYHMSPGNEGNRCGQKNSRDEIVEQLSKIKIGYNKHNMESDSGTVDDLTSNNDLPPNSIIAGNREAYVSSISSIHSVADSRFSIILAGRLDSREDLYAPHSDEQSLLNIAINESVQTNDPNQSNNAELSRWLDSLEAPRKEVVSSEVSEKDSLESEAHCTANKPKNINARNDLIDVDENTNPNLPKSIKRGQPKVISNETFHYPVKMIKQSAKKPANNREGEFLKPVSNYRSNMAEESSSSLEERENNFHSLLSESERLIIANIKTPNAKEICFIENCCKSTPGIGVNADTFGSELISDISNLSSLGCENLEQTGDNSKSAHSCREKIFTRFSHQFAQEPTKFTERLLTLVEESFLGQTNTEVPDTSGVNLSRLTEEFRKILKDYGKRIEDESMPDFALGPSFNESHLSDRNLEARYSAIDETVLSPFRNFSKLGGGEKTYRKTPRKILQANKGTHCNTPNCGNPMHREKNNNTYRSDYSWDVDGIHDDTADFELWEKRCCEITPNRGSRPKVMPAEIPGVATREDFISKIDQQMAILDMSTPFTLESEKEERFQYEKRNDQNCSTSMKQKSIEHLPPSSATGKDKSNANQKLKHNGLARIIEKRRKCFEEARKVFESKKNSPFTTKKSESLEKNKSLMELNCQTGFINTLSACVDYFEHVKTLRGPGGNLQCILECTEELEYPNDKTFQSGSTKIVEAVILPRKHRAEYKIDIPNSNSTNNNQIARSYLYIPGTPKVSNDKSLSISPKRRSYLSPHSRSPRTQSGNVLTKKIRSPVSPAKRRSLRAVKPVSHAWVPRTPSITPEIHKSENKKSSESSKSGINSIPRCASHNKLKSSTNKSSTINVTNITKKNCIPKVILTNASPSCDSLKKSIRTKVLNEIDGVECQRTLEFAGSDTPVRKPKRFFYTPERIPSHGKIKPKIKYFDTPKQKSAQKKTPVISPGPYRVNYNTVQSPVGLYIRGIKQDLMTDVTAKSNENMLTPRSTTPKTRSNVRSPILARSPCMSPQPTESSRLKFRYTPARRQDSKPEDNLLNIALCESDLSSNIGTEIKSHSPFPKIFYKPAPSLKMVGND